MLELKESLGEEVSNKIEIEVNRIRKPEIFDHVFIKYKKKMRELAIMGLFNPRLILEIEDIVRSKEYWSAVYNLPYLFG